MSKRVRDEPAGNSDQPQKKRKGFSVAPSNLPDGTYKRKAQKIKDDLIKKAKVKKAYAKVKAQAEQETGESTYNPYDAEETESEAKPLEEPQDESKSLELHPARMAMLEEPEQELEPARPERNRARKREGRGERRGDEEDVNGFRSRGSDRPVRQARKDEPEKPIRYVKEFAQAEQRKSQLDAQRKAREERDKERRAMAKARKTGRDGKMKLGRQGTVLLGRVQRMKSEGKI